MKLRNLISTVTLLSVSAFAQDSNDPFNGVNFVDCTVKTITGGFSSFIPPEVGDRISFSLMHGPESDHNLGPKFQRRANGGVAPYIPLLNYPQYFENQNGVPSPSRYQLTWSKQRRSISYGEGLTQVAIYRDPQTSEITGWIEVVNLAIGSPTQVDYLSLSCQGR